MALYGVLGDIHANREALEAVLAALAARGAQKLLCVGDVVGYNADPDECVALPRQRAATVIAGNHDLIATGRLGFERCSNKARYSLGRTRRRLSAHSAAWLCSLPSRALVAEEIALVHGGVRDVQLYMTSASHIRRNAELLRADFPSARVCFFGHSHDQKIYEVTGGEVRELPLDRPSALSRERRYFVNAGSVDAQRKRSERLAECALFDSNAWTVEFLRVPYNAAATEAKAAAAGYRIPALTDWLYRLRSRLLPAT
ncbi:MAG: metallophosphoesterase [Burkholderiales bacterium]